LIFIFLIIYVKIILIFDISNFKILDNNHTLEISYGQEVGLTVQKVT